ncbi:DUF7003 family protein [Sulfitobacter sp. M368]|uniref:DUF7003 family protein n=1 Tax=Sulfitobacter sp. M368 TaxID=2867021 RepID=UPI0021A60B10|nr:hypothetical protein [Sulfitobacter sp. M368]UWR13773.1 hypothetical protein K3754_10535 [Sulfitobacter sp. M368]
MKKIFQRRQRSLLTAKAILGVLDQSSEAFAFPMLDNGYVYLAASRLSLFRSDEHWAVVFEIFGFSPRAGRPDLSIVTISSELHDRNKPTDYVSKEAYDNYLKHNPYWEMRNFWPISNEEWMDQENWEFVAGNGQIVIRGQSVDIPQTNAYSSKGVDLEKAQPAVFELCRFLAHDHREELLATETERRVSVLPSMKQIMLIDEWHHPDLVNGQTPSQTETFRQLARVLEANDTTLYSTAELPNNHWKNWPEGGTL